MHTHGTEQSGTSSDRTKAPPEGATSVPLIEQLLRHVAELREFGSHFVQAKLDAAKASLKTAVMYAVVGLIGAVVVLTVLCTGAVLLTIGLGGALGALFHIPWLGNLVAGLAVIALILGVTWVGVGAALKSSKAKIEALYATRAARQRSAFGQDVHDRAGRAAPATNGHKT